MDNILQVPGFKAAAVKSGIRGKDRLDLGLIVSEGPAAAAGVFTTSRVKAAPVVLDMERLDKGGRAQAILVNSGIANACTGENGRRQALLASRLAAEALGIEEDLVQVASTGVIGEQIDMDCFRKGIPLLVEKLAESGLPEVARAIMTTDTVPKTAVRVVELGGRQVTIAGLAKGSGMIMPNMATMLSFVLTDAKIEPALLSRLLAKAVGKSFNAITVDGDTSTNDTLLLLANGMAGNTPFAPGSPDYARFEEALVDLCRELALMIVRDGEGATKLVTVRVTGAASELEADLAARTVANSNLVKTAFFGEDANWGRIIAALGRSGAAFDPGRVDIAFNQVFMVRDGLGQGKEVEKSATEVLRQKEFTVEINLKAGGFVREIYTCDFSIDYVKINADYRT
jgi:glutamate N-acetyltransferase/amino-acid N-acetyltransferase